MHKRQFLVAMAVFIIVTLVAACGQTLQPQAGVTSEPGAPTGPTQKATAEPAAPTAPPVQEPTAAPEAQKPTRLVIAQGVDAESMDAMFTQARFTENTLIHIFERLVKLNNETMQWDPLLATSWKRIDDLTMEFKLREGVKFHDGEDFNADAVKYTVDRLYSADSEAASFLKGFFDLDKVEVVDPYTVRISSKKPTNSMLEWAGALYIYAPKYYSSITMEEAALKPVGTGPYEFVEWVPDDHITMKRFDGYWGPKPAIDEIVWRPIPEAAVRVSELLAGSVDIIVNVPPDMAEQVNSSGNAEVRTVAGGRDIFIGIRNDVDFFKDVKVRQALNYAVDVPTILQGLLPGVKPERLASLANNYVNPDVKAYPYDPEKAKQLLAEAGWTDSDGDGVLDKNGQKFEVTMDSPAGRYIKDKEIAQAVASYLEAVGLKVNVNVLEWSVYAQKMFVDVNPAELYLLGLGSSFNGQEEMRYIQKDFGYNPTFWVNNDFENLYAELEKTYDEAKRTEILYQLQVIAHDDPPIIYLYKQLDFYGVNKNLDWTPRRDELIYLEGAKFK